MDCSEVLDLLGAWMDGELDADLRAALDIHLESCESCGRAAELSQLDDARLLRGFAARRQGAASVAERVIGQLSARELMARSAPAESGRIKQLAWIAAAAAAGFVAALCAFPPWQQRDGAGEDSVARLTVATGQVHLRLNDDDRWQPLDRMAQFACPPGSAVKTGPATQCELETSDGSFIRLDADTELRLAADRKLELSKGQIWCSTPQAAPFEVKASPQITARVAGGEMGMSCLPGQQSVVTVGKGQVDVQATEGARQVRSGQSVRIVDNKIVDVDSADSLMATRWMYPLLTRKGYRDEELATRVDQLLARIGQAKLSNLYEQEIRSLGAYCALPLTRFIQSELSAGDPARRRRAMHILSDVAQPWSIPDLIQLLADDDGEIRYFAATALERLTDVSIDLDPSEWRAGSEQRRGEAHAKWLAWWEENKSRYPLPW